MIIEQYEGGRAVKRHANRSQNAAIEDEDSLTRFAEEVGPRALRLAFRWTRNRQMAEDVVQEAFLRTWQSRTRIAESSHTWFFKILWNVFLNHQKRVRSNRESGLEHDTPVLEMDQSYERIDDKLDIEGLLATLPEMDRHLLAMRYGEDFTIQDIFDITGMPVGTVKSRIRRALKQLRKSRPSLLCCPFSWVHYRICTAETKMTTVVRAVRIVSSASRGSCQTRS